MKNEILIRHIDAWINSARSIDETFGKLEDLLMTSPENPIRGAIWGMFDRYTDTLSKLIGDDGAAEWLDWFAWETDFGKKKMSMSFKSGKSQIITTAAQLLAAIRNDDTAAS